MGATNTNIKCRICGNMDGNLRYKVMELMLGTGDEFEYFKCGSCGCLQINEIPENLADYYPGDYYSFKDYTGLARRRVKRLFDTKRLQYYLTGRGIVGRFASLRTKPPKYFAWVREIGISADSSILDVGAGSGKLLVKMSLAGFHHCIGIDQYIQQNIDYPSGVRIIKQDLFGFAGATRERFDLIMFHHSYEHMPDPAGVLQTAAGLLNHQGVILMHIPLSDSHAWDVYKEYWVQLDAPRHLFLHTPKSMELLAREAGLCVDKIVYDSTDFQFIGSELYKRNIPLAAEKEKHEFFKKEEIRMFQKQAVELNRSGRGDQASLYLKNRS